MTIAQTYTTWRQTLKTPDDSIFYYHKSLDRILLTQRHGINIPYPLLLSLNAL